MICVRTYAVDLCIMEKVVSYNEVSWPMRGTYKPTATSHWDDPAIERLYSLALRALSWLGLLALEDDASLMVIMGTSSALRFPDPDARLVLKRV